MVVISQIDSIGVGGWEAGAGGKLKAGQSKHSNTNGSAVPSVGDPDWYNSLGIGQVCR